MYVCDIRRGVLPSRDFKGPSIMYALIYSTSSVTLVSPAGNGYSTPPTPCVPPTLHYDKSAPSLAGVGGAHGLMQRIRDGLEPPGRCTPKWSRPSETKIIHRPLLCYTVAYQWRCPAISHVDRRPFLFLFAAESN